MKGWTGILVIAPTKCSKMPSGLCDCFLLRKNTTPRRNMAKEKDSKTRSRESLMPQELVYQDISVSSLAEQPLLDPVTEAKSDPFAPSFSPFNSPRMCINSKDVSRTSNQLSEKKNRNIARQMNSRLSFLLQRQDTVSEQNDSALEETDKLSKATRPSLEEVMSWSRSLETLLSSCSGVATFRSFLQSEYSDENLEFWLACEKYRSTCITEMDHAARRIFTEFIGVQAPKEINLDSHTRDSILASLNQPTLCSFDTAQKRVYSLMEKDSYPRFLRSDLYLHCME